MLRAACNRLQVASACVKTSADKGYGLQVAGFSGFGQHRTFLRSNGSKNLLNDMD
jgi:hypothetical protein